MNQETST